MFKLFTDIFSLVANRLRAAGNFTQQGIVCWNYNCESGYGEECIETTYNGKDKDSGLRGIQYTGTWILTFCAIWFFLARKKGDEEQDRNVGLEFLGWFFIFLTSAVGIAIIENGESALVFMLGGIVMIVSLIKMMILWNEE